MDRIGGWRRGSGRRRARAAAMMALVVAVALFSAGSARGARGATRASAVSTPTMSCLSEAGLVPPTDIYSWHVGKVVHVLSWFDTWGASDCQLKVAPRALIEHSKNPYWDSTVVKAIKRAPGLDPIDVTLKPGAVVAREWTWSNWCGTRSTPFAAQVNWALGDEPFQPAIGAPSCVKRSAPSTLKPTTATISSCPLSSVHATFSAEPIRLRQIITVQLTTTRRSPCTLSGEFGTRVTALIDGRWRTLSSIQGTPSAQGAGMLLAPSNPGTLFWQWMNWCGNANLKFRFATTFRGRTFLGPVEQSTANTQFPPYCNSSAYPSTLAPSYGIA